MIVLSPGERARLARLAIERFAEKKACPFVDKCPSRPMMPASKTTDKAPPQHFQVMVRLQHDHSHPITLNHQFSHIPQVCHMLSLDAFSSRVKQAVHGVVRNRERRNLKIFSWSVRRRNEFQRSALDIRIDSANVLSRCTPGLCVTRKPGMPQCGRVFVGDDHASMSSGSHGIQGFRFGLDSACIQNSCWEVRRRYSSRTAAAKTEIFTDTVDRPV